MCDYSLHSYATRLAKENEELVCHRFWSGSMGLASPAELRRLGGELPGRRFSWTALRDWWGATRRSVAAVCIPPGARLEVQNIPVRLQRRIGVGATETVTFTQITAEEHVYRDALRFRNGKQVLIQELEEGMPVKVLSLTPVEPETSVAARDEAEELLYWSR